MTFSAITCHSTELKFVIILMMVVAQEPPVTIFVALYRHEVSKESCSECGIGESVRSSEKLLEKYAIMDNYLKKIGKCIVSVEKDGNCLVKSVYQSLLERGIMKELKGYRALLTMVSDHIISEKKHYANYI